jgi:hypothetical protein
VFLFIVPFVKFQNVTGSKVSVIFPDLEVLDTIPQWPKIYRPYFEGYDAILRLHLIHQGANLSDALGFGLIAAVKRIFAQGFSKSPIFAHFTLLNSFPCQEFLPRPNILSRDIGVQTVQ